MRIIYDMPRGLCDALASDVIVSDGVIVIDGEESRANTRFHPVVFPYGLVVCRNLILYSVSLFLRDGSCL